MARKPNYNFEKRRKEQERKQRQEEKRSRKRETNARSDDASEPPTPPVGPDLPGAVAPE